MESPVVHQRLFRLWTGESEGEILAVRVVVSSAQLRLMS